MSTACVAALALPGVLGAAPAQAEGELPIVGQALTTSNDDTAQTTLDVVISVHGVRRVKDATMVYWSVGYTPEASSGATSQALLESFGSQSTLSPPRGGVEPMGDVAIIDLAERKAYTTLYTGESMDDCVCQSWTDVLPGTPEPGKAYVTAAALPALPRDLKTVTLRVAGQIFPAVTIEDGAMEPIAEKWPIIVGMGWPRVKTDAISKVKDPGQFVLPLTTHELIENTSMSQRTKADSRALDLSADVLFAVDEATLTSKATQEIKAAAERITTTETTGTITVVGHTDSSGDDAHNQGLSERRAEAVAKALTPLLPDGVKLTTAGKGESDPIASNETEDGKALNRRVTITLPGAN